MSDPKLRKSIRALIIRHLREWHRRLGIWAAFFLIFLSLTGMALNHTNYIGLAHQAITSSWFLDHYGIKKPSTIEAYQENKIVVTDQLVWLNDQLLLTAHSKVIAAGTFQQFWLVLTEQQLAIFDVQGELVDKIDSSLGLPENITGMAILEKSVIVNTHSGYYQTNENLIDWQSISTMVEPKWITTNPLNEVEVASASTRFRSQFLTLERIIVDAHSGRIFGDFGVFFMDLVALCLILLSVSGIYIWMRYKKSQR